ncbi:Cytochrome c oxidase subunit III [Roseibium album]|nr:Cytochrome c oxidase subunit III [Roseibium album]
MRRPVFLVIAAFAVILLAIYALGVGDKKDQTGNGQIMVEVSVPALDVQTKLGERLFNENCASCHGENAAGQQGVAPPLVHKIYEPNHHADGSFQLAVTRGVRAHHWPFGNMPPVEGLTSEDVAKIVAYVRFLQRANGIN